MRETIIITTIIMRIVKLKEEKWDKNKKEETQVQDLNLNKIKSSLTLNLITIQNKTNDLLLVYF